MKSKIEWHMRYTVIQRHTHLGRPAYRENHTPVHWFTTLKRDNNPIPEMLGIGFIHLFTKTPRGEILQSPKNLVAVIPKL